MNNQTCCLTVNKHYYTTNYNCVYPIKYTFDIAKACLIYCFRSDEYSDLQTSNPAFQDPYTTLQNPIGMYYLNLTRPKCSSGELF